MEDISDDEEEQVCHPVPRNLNRIIKSIDEDEADDDPCLEVINVDDEEEEESLKKVMRQN